jgi:hypothetical protein
MAESATGLDATAYPAINQTMTARTVAQTLSDVFMVTTSSVCGLPWCCS